MTGSFDGLYLSVPLYDVPAYLDQGWEIAFVVLDYRAVMKAPLP